MTELDRKDFLLKRLNELSQLLKSLDFRNQTDYVKAQYIISLCVENLVSIKPPTYQPKNSIR